MRKTICLLYFTITAIAFLQAQQLYLEGFAGRNRSSFDSSPYKNDPQGFTTVGARLAAGADHLQLGAEYQQNLNNPMWDIRDIADNKIGTEEFETTYYGLFLRSKISKYPAWRFGIVLRAGAGMYNTKKITSVTGLTQSQEYKQTPGFNGGIGVAVPVIRNIMLELGYTYHFVEYEANDLLPKLNGSFHTAQAGISMNFVFGKRAREYDRIRKR